ncbi:MAG: hypothetical protein K6G61_05610 [Solobacterium sp.]|nr:hypothetical protein [Solobacterium sp.]
MKNTLIKGTLAFTLLLAAGCTAPASSAAPSAAEEEQASEVTEEETAEETAEETEQQTEEQAAPEEEAVTNLAYVYSAAEAGMTNDFSGIAAPHFYIYAGMKTEDEAKALIDELGMQEVTDKWVGTITVVNPLNSESYTEEDAAQFPELLGFMTSNAKVIGIGEGADFVNNHISQECWAVAGILTFGGEMQEGLTYNVPVPAYLVNPSETAEEYYIRAISGTEVEDGVYEDPDNTLARVVVSRSDDPAEEFANAWEKVFSRNYRQHNELTECYNSSAAVQTEPYPLIGIMDPEALGLTYNTYYNQPLNGEGEYTWFEYIPNDVLEAEEGTVPLVVTLHGNGNDARIQGDTTGWPELAVKEGFIVAAPEWQTVALVEGTSETKPNFFNCDGLERDRLIEWIEMLKGKYPQIDASRIYVTGLSAGASASTLYGALYSDVFAAVGAVSGPGVDKDELASLTENYEGNEMPWLYICGDHDFFGMLPVDGSSTNSFQVAEGVYIQSVDPASSMFSFIQSYQKINGIEVQEEYDMAANAYYGVAGDSQEWITLGEKAALETDLNNANGLSIRLTAIKDQAHWNYKPEAEYIWDFFRQFSRNTETGELIRN